MLLTWQRFFFVFWLALLQGVSPLLHAHVLGQVAQRGVHMHLLENERATAVPYWHNVPVHDGTEIGVAQAGRHDAQALYPNLPHAVIPRPSEASRIAGLTRLYSSQGIRAPPADASHLVPPAQAPPFRAA